MKKLAFSIARKIKKLRLTKKTIAFALVGLIMLSFLPFDTNQNNNTFAAGLIMKGSSYIISSEADLIELRDNNNYRGTTATFIQTNDIQLTKAWNKPINDFCGIYDGGNFSITNLYGSIIGSDNTYNSVNATGFFGWVRNGAEIKNLTLVIGTEGFKVGAVATDTSNLVQGALIGYLSSASKIINCATKKASENSKFTGNTEKNVTDNIYVGGVVGSADASSIVSQCYSNLNIETYKKTGSSAIVYTGGIAGQAVDALIKNCMFEGSIKSGINTESGAGFYIGAGIVGCNSKSIISHCYADISTSAVKCPDNYKNFDGTRKLGIYTVVPNSSYLTTSFLCGITYMSEDFVPPMDNNYWMCGDAKRNNNIATLTYNCNIIEVSFSGLGIIGIPKVEELETTSFLTGFVYPQIKILPTGIWNSSNFTYQASSNENTECVDMNDDLTNRTDAITQGNLVINLNTNNPDGTDVWEYKDNKTTLKWLNAIPKPTAIPASTDALYPFEISKNDPIQLTAKTGVIEYSFEYTKMPTLAQPVYSNGGASIDLATKTITIPKNGVVKFTSTNNSTMYYTTDGTNPTKLSAQYNSTDGITISNFSAQVKIIASANNFINSPVATFSFVQEKLAKPVANPLPSDINVSADITLTALTGAEIEYKISATQPTTSGTTYNFPVTVNEGDTLWAKAKTGTTNYTDSDWASFTYPAMPIVPTPSISNSVVSGKMSITITDTDSGASIYYTTDGSIPNATSTAYSGDFEISSTKTIKAIAIKTGNKNSSVATKLVTITKLTEPSASPFPRAIDGSASITLTAQTGATIEYKISDTQPTTAGDIYSSPITVAENDTLWARATKQDSVTSDWKSFEYPAMEKLLAPTISYNSTTHKVTISKPSGADTVYYTTNGSLPTTSSNAYSSEFAVTSGQKIQAFAVGSGYKNSNVASRDIPTFSAGNAGVWNDYSAPFTLANEVSDVMPNTVITMTIRIKGYPQTEVKYYYSLKNSVATPVISPSGEEQRIDETKGIQITCSTVNSVIYYTTNGDDPKTATATIYKGAPIKFPDNTNTFTVKTYAKSEDATLEMTDSDVATVTYSKSNRPRISMPNILMGEDKIPFDSTKYYDEGTSIYISHSNSTSESFQVVYNINQTTSPSINGYIYENSSPLKVIAGTSGNMVLNCVAKLNNYDDSETATFTIHMKGIGKSPIPSISNGSTIMQGDELIFSLDSSNIEASMKPNASGIIETTNTSFKYQVPEIWYMIGDGNPLEDGQIFNQGSPEIKITSGETTNTIPKTLPESIKLNGNSGEQIIVSAIVKGNDNFSNSKIFKFRYKFTGTTVTPSITPATSDANITIAKKSTKLYMNTSTIGANIYYTVDGSTPEVTKSGIGSSTMLYDSSNPIEIPDNATSFFTVIAISVKYKDSTKTTFELENSQPVKFTYQIPANVQAPFASPRQGEVLKGSKIALKSSTKDAKIFYEFGYDGSPVSQPNIMTSALYDDTMPIVIDKPCVIKAIAEKDGVLSEIITYNYTLAGKVLNPIASVKSGSIVAKGSSITIETTTEDATIIYTKDGSDPSKDGNTNAITGNVILADGELGSTITIRVFAKKNGLSPSEIATFSYIINDQVGGITANPPSGAKVSQGTVISLSSSVSNSEIYYTTDGTIPTINSQKGNRITLRGIPGETVSIKAMAVTSGATNGPIATFIYTFLKRTPVPTASIPNNSVVISGAKLSLSAKDAIIYYTTDGTDPTTSSNQYVSKINIDKSMIVKMIAFSNDLEVSEILQASYSIANQVLAPTFSKSSGAIDINTKISMSTATEGATIYYTTNGKEPDISDIKNMLVYSSPITVSRAVTIKAIAVKDGMQQSAVNTSLYTVIEPVVEEEDDTTQTNGDVQNDRLASRRTYVNQSSGPAFSGVVLKNDGTNAIMSADKNVIPLDATLEVRDLIVGESDIKAVQNSLGKAYTILSLYEFSVSSDNSKVQPSGKVEIGLPIYSKSQNGVIMICRINDDGTVESFPTRRDGNTAYAIDDQLSKYAVVTGNAVDLTTQKEIYKVIILIIALALILTFVAVFVQRNRKKRNH